MKNIWLLTKTNIIRYKIALVISVAGAFLLCFFLYSMGNLSVNYEISKIKLGLIDSDKSILSQDFKDYLTDDLNYELLEDKSYDMLSTELIDKDISVIIEIPEGFYQKAYTGMLDNITVTSLDDYENAAFLQANLNSYLRSIKLLSDSAGGEQTVFDQLLQDYEKEKVILTQTAAQEIDKQLLREQEGFNNSIGFFLMIVFALGIFISFLIVEDRYSGVFNRISITPVKPVQYIIGSGIFGLLICFIEVWIYCGFIKLMNINIGFPLPILLLMMSLFSLFTVFFSIAVSLSLKSKNGLTAVIVVFSTIGCILGGAYFPLDLAPKSLQNLARVLPQFWFMDTFRTIQANPEANIYPNVIILLLFTVLTFLIGAVLFSQNYKRN